MMIYARSVVEFNHIYIGTCLLFFDFFLAHVLRVTELVLWFQLHLSLSH